MTFFFAVSFSTSFLNLLFSATVLHCATFVALKYIPEVKLGFLLVVMLASKIPVVSSFASIFPYVIFSFLEREVILCFLTYSYAEAQRTRSLDNCCISFSCRTTIG